MYTGDLFKALYDLYGEKKKSWNLPTMGAQDMVINGAVVIDLEGNPVGFEYYGKGKDGKNLTVCKAPTRSSGIKAGCMHDTSDYVLGWKNTERGAGACDAFYAKCIEFRNACQDFKGADAVVKFYEKFTDGDKVNKDAIHAALMAFDGYAEMAKDFPEEYTRDKKKPQTEAKSFRITFMLDGDCITVAESDEAINFMAGGVENAFDAYCMVTGKYGPCVKTAMQVSGIPGTKNIPIACCQQNECYDSMGHTQGENFPLSVDADFKIGSVLKWLLNKENNHKLSIQKNKNDMYAMVWWASDKVEALPFFQELIERSEHNSNSEITPGDLKKYMDGLTELDGGKYYVLTVIGANGRYSVVDWRCDTMAERLKHMQVHFDDMSAFGLEDHQKSAKHIAKAIELPNHDDAAMRDERLLKESIFNGNPYSAELLNKAAQRMLANETSVSTFNCKIIASFLAAGMKRNNNVKLDNFMEDKSFAFLAGRLLAVNEKIQYEATHSVKPAMQALKNSPERWFAENAVPTNSDKKYSWYVKKLAGGHGERMKRMRDDLISELCEVVEKEGFKGHLAKNDVAMVIIGMQVQKDMIYAKKPEKTEETEN